jgi:hypothetical protein
VSVRNAWGPICRSHDEVELILLDKGIEAYLEESVSPLKVPSQLEEPRLTIGARMSCSVSKVPAYFFASVDFLAFWDNIQTNDNTFDNSPSSRLHTAKMRVVEVIIDVSGFALCFSCLLTFTGLQIVRCTDSNKWMG